MSADHRSDPTGEWLVRVVGFCFHHVVPFPGGTGEKRLARLP